MSQVIINNYSGSGQQPIGQQPAAQLKTNRSMIKLILLSIITFGIYSLVFYNGIASDLNLIASRYDGKKTMNYWLLALIITPITFGIGTLVWYHKMSARVGEELSRRRVGGDFSAGTYWLWGIIGSCIIIGPFIYLHKLCDSMNRLAADYNSRG